MFSGFSKDTITFLKGLSKNNNKTWFDGHREEYETHYMEPARQFVATLGPELMKIEPGVRYEAKVNKSIFRINRDIRFSKDKTPYKDHIDVVLDGRQERVGYRGLLYSYHIENTDPGSRHPLF